mmetsp:Transcript_848/g.1972  ORF Transcript_848/g.1972 Transcript_848/m.1972 type:complete len:279 (+) Transcript_848:6308-7144(+)
MSDRDQAIFNLLKELEKSSKLLKLRIGSLHRTKALNSIQHLIDRYGWKSLKLANLSILGLICARAAVNSREFWLLKGNAIEERLPIEKGEDVQSVAWIIMNYASTYPYMRPSFFEGLRSEYTRYNSLLEPSTNLQALKSLNKVGYGTSEVTDIVLNSVTKGGIKTEQLGHIVNAYKGTFEADKKLQYKDFIETLLEKHVDYLIPSSICYFIRALAYENFNSKLVARLADKVASDLPSLNQYQLNDCIRTFGTYDKSLCKPFIIEKNGRPLQRSALLAD